MASPRSEAEADDLEKDQAKEMCVSNEAETSDVLKILDPHLRVAISGHIGTTQENTNDTHHHFKISNVLTLIVNKLLVMALATKYNHESVF